MSECRWLCLRQESYSRDHGREIRSLAFARGVCRELVCRRTRYRWFSRRRRCPPRNPRRRCPGDWPGRGCWKEPSTAKCLRRGIASWRGAPGRRLDFNVTSGGFQCLLDGSRHSVRKELASNGVRMRVQSALVWCLICLQTGIGCAGPRANVRTEDNVFTQAAYAPTSHAEPARTDWLDEHPVVKYATYTAVGTMAVVGILTTAVIVAVAT